jgi:hypothetical protein
MTADLTTSVGKSIVSFCPLCRQARISQKHAMARIEGAAKLDSYKPNALVHCRLIAKKVEFWTISGTLGQICLGSGDNA